MQATTRNASTNTRCRQLQRYVQPRAVPVTMRCADDHKRYVQRRALPTIAHGTGKHTLCQQQYTVSATTYAADVRTRYRPTQTMPAAIHSASNHTLCQQSHAM